MIINESLTSSNKITANFTPRSHLPRLVKTKEMYLWLNFDRELIDILIKEKIL